MPSEYNYGTFANYSPRGSSELSENSRKICGAIKAGKINLLETAVPILRQERAAILQPFLDARVTLVPVPKSAPLVEGALWPSRVICDVLRSNGFGMDVAPFLVRARAVRRSSTSPAAERPLWIEHFESIEVDPAPLFQPKCITLVDDVLTMGRTSYACAERLREVFPDTEIRIFAMIRTQGLIPDIERFVDPSVGTITGYDSGRTHRAP